MKKKNLFLIILSSVIVVLFITVMIYYFGACYKEFYAIASKQFKIPGLETKFVPQGLDYDGNDYFLVSGYMSNGENSRIYFVDKTSKAVEKYITLKVNGQDYKGHAGGIAVSGNYAYIVADKYVHRINYLSALDTENGDSLQVLDSFQSGNGADFVLVKDNSLFIGEFYKKDKYDTPQAHHIKISNEETNYALTYVYDINQSKPYGIESTVPKAVISMPNQVQGMTFNKNGDIVLSTSYSIPSSKILVYENVLNSVPTKLNLNGNETDLYILSSDNLKTNLKAPAMSEEIVLVDDKVFVLFESNCSKYRFFNRTRLSNVYALDL